MKTPGAIAAKNAGAGFVALLAGGAIWGLIQGSWPNFMGLGAVGVVLGMSVAWAAREAYAAGQEAGRSPGAPASS